MQYVSPAPEDARDIATLAFFTTIHEMRAGERPVDVDHLIDLAHFVLDAHAHSAISRHQQIEEIQRGRSPHE